MQARDGVVFEMKLHDGRSAVGWVITNKFPRFLVPLFTILGVVDDVAEVEADRDGWVAAHREEPLVTPMLVTPTMFGKFRMARRLGVVDSKFDPAQWGVMWDDSLFDPVRNQRYASKINREPVGQEESYQRRDEWDIVNAADRSRTALTMEQQEGLYIVAKSTLMPGAVDIVLAQVLAVHEGKPIPQRHGPELPEDL